MVAGEYVDIETAKQSGRTSFDEMIRCLRKHTTVLVEKNRPSLPQPQGTR